MDTEKIIEAKRVELETDLARWATEQGLLGSNERIECQVSILILKLPAASVAISVEKQTGRLQTQRVDTNLTPTDFDRILSLSGFISRDLRIINLFKGRNNATASALELSRIVVEAGTKAKYPTDCSNLHAYNGIATINRVLLRNRVPYRLLETGARTERFSFYRVETK